MKGYARLDFATWSATAELVDSVAATIPAEILAAYEGLDLHLPGYVFRDGREDLPQSFIIAGDEHRWWSILWSGERVEADNLLDVAIDVWQSRLLTVGGL
jgi:hypothetical protein